MKLLDKALIFATRAHGSQRRKYTGEPYIVHPILVSEKIAQLGFGEEMRCAALLHDVLEDSATTEGELEAEFGTRITKMVVDLTDVYTHEAYPNIPRKQRKMLEAYRLWTVENGSKSIKIADIIDNTPSIMEFGKDFSPVYLQEARELLQVLQGGNKQLMQEAIELLNIWEKKILLT